MQVTEVDQVHHEKSGDSFSGDLPCWEVYIRDFVIFPWFRLLGSAWLCGGKLLLL